MNDQGVDIADDDGWLAAIGGRAAGADRGLHDLTEDIAAMHAANWLTACLPRSSGGRGWGTQSAGAIAAFDALRGLGQVSLPAARLFEGHMNAVKLVHLYASDNLARYVYGAVKAGTMLGVWGADMPGEPLTMDRFGNAVRFSGAKQYCSGLGMVGLAIVTGTLAGEQRLAILPVTDADRMDAERWSMSAMRATLSGSYRFDGLTVCADKLIGAAGDYQTEPYFEGGIWRYCAAQLGAAGALYAAMRSALVESGRAEAPMQALRLVQAAIALETARLWVRRAAQEIEADEAPPRKAVLALLAREVTHQSCDDVLSSVEQALGMAAHNGASAIERMGRDLRLYLCQAAPDAKLARAAGGLLAGPGTVEAL
jgi:alkylation response protein AidB-like acyl-CoA dehydrogenase